MTTRKEELLEAIADAIHGPRSATEPFPGMYETVLLPRYERLADAILSVQGEPVAPPQHGENSSVPSPVVPVAKPEDPGKPVALVSPEEIEAVAHRLLHRLWTKAVGTSDYDKKAWQDLEASLFRLSREGKPSGASEGKNPVCGDHWHGLSGAMVDGSTGCPWCHIETLQQQIQRLEADGDEAKFSPTEWFRTMLRLRLQAFPTEAFPEGPLGEHGATVDVCSARAIRSLLKDLIGDVEKFIEETARANRRK